MYNLRKLEEIVEYHKLLECYIELLRKANVPFEECVGMLAISTALEWVLGVEEPGIVNNIARIKGQLHFIRRSIEEGKDATSADFFRNVLHNAYAPA